MSHVVLLEHGSADPAGVVVRRVRMADRIAARVRVLSLDRQLAAGAPPESTAALTLRAQRLLRPQERKRMAQVLRDLVRHVERSPSIALPLARRHVLDAAPLFHRLAHRLDGAEPVDVRGVAIARLLITDGTGPLYSSRSSRELAEAVEDALHAVPATHQAVAGD
jgi:hypothetical protein